MTLTQLSNFIRICELGSVTKAAAVARIAQPALSRQVRLLEQELGAALLVRLAWGVLPTEAGEALLAHAREVLRGVQRARDAVRELTAEPSGRVAVGLPPSLAACLLPSLALRIRGTCPRLQPRFVEDLSGQLRRRIYAGELDIALLYEERAPGPVVVTRLLTERVLWVVAPKSSGEGLTICSPGEPLILPTRPSGLRDVADEVVEAAGLGGSPVMEIDSLPGILGVVAAGGGSTILPFSAVGHLVERGELQAKPLGQWERSRTIVLARPSDRPVSPAVAAVTATIQDAVRDLAPTLQWVAAADGL